MIDAQGGLGYEVGVSSPAFASGMCPRCQSLVPVDPISRFNDDGLSTCSNCGADSPRRLLILESLANLWEVNWGLLASNFWIGARNNVELNNYVSYDISDAPERLRQHGITADQVDKWNHHVVFVDDDDDAGLYVTLNATENKILIGLSALWNSRDTAPVRWWRFGISNRDVVPAWRQSLFGAFNLITTSPSAAVVMIAAGYEAFFIETLRVKWVERGFDLGAFERLNERNPPVATLMRWLPEIVGLQSLTGTLQEDWMKKVNQLRNDVVHRGNVHVTSEEARDSLRVALTAMVAIDPAALVRPHAYWTGPQR